MYQPTTCGHIDGFDYADYLTEPEAWASRVLAIVGTQFEGELHIAAVKDYSLLISVLITNGRLSVLPPRGRYIEDHVQGQIDRAREFAVG